MGWQQAEEAAEKAKGGKFIKLENDGDWVVVAFPFCGPGVDDEPIVTEEFWDDKEDKNVPFTAEHKAAGKTPSSKFHFNAYVVKEMGDKKNKAPEECELKIYGCSVSTFKEILAIRDKYGMDKFYEIKRHGAAKSKKTKYKVLFDGDIDAAHKARIAELAKDKHDLKNINDDDDDTKQGSKSKSNGAAASGGAALISDAVAQELLPKLKELPNEKRNAFLKDFGVSRARELKMSDVERVKKWLADALAPAPTEKKEDDAFT